jgi:hypothetical protein
MPGYNKRRTHPNPNKSAPKNPYFVRGGAEEFEAIRYISIFYYFITLVFIFNIQYRLIYFEFILR